MITINSRTIGFSKFFGPVITFGFAIYLIISIITLGYLLSHKNDSEKYKTDKEALLRYYAYTNIWVILILIAIQIEYKVSY